MKKIIAVVLMAGVLISCTSAGQVAGTKTGYKVVPDSADKILKGYLSRNVIESDTSFKWFGENMKYGSADAAAVEAFRKNAANFNVIVFGGTWCHDTQNLLPVFYRLVEKSGFPENKITLIGVDRAKTAPDDLDKTYKITNVPTFIIMHNGKEVGRVVEYGTEGQIDKELGEIVAKSVAN